MKTVWKFPIDATDRQTVMMPRGAQILSAQVQGEQLCLWALVEPTARKEPREIEVIGTGAPAPDCTRCYIGTAQQGTWSSPGLILVRHVFEITGP